MCPNNLDRFWDSITGEFNLFLMDSPSKMMGKQCNFLKPTLPDPQAELCHLLPVQPSANYSISPSFRQLVCKTGTITVPKGLLRATGEMGSVWRSTQTAFSVADHSCDEDNEDELLLHPRIMAQQRNKRAYF